MLGNVAWANPIANVNKKVGTLSNRLINVTCPYWKGFDGGLLNKNYTPREFDGLLNFTVFSPVVDVRTL
eukprot:1117161-Pyramimonas_sp.AAC.1